MTPVRLAAARVLVAVERGRTTLAAEVDRGRSHLAEARDRALLLELVSGTLRWQRALDGALDACSRRPLSTLDGAVRAVLRLAAYQLRHLDRVPAHAVVHEAVEATRALGHARAAGLVNAVLRKLARSTAPAVPPAPADAADRTQTLAYLAVALSHPEWLAARWLDRHGFDAAAAWCRFNNDAPEVSVRPMRGESAADLVLRLAAEGIEAAPGRVVRDALRLPPGSLGRLAPATRARVAVLDEGSQLVAHALGVRPGDRVLDVCAAPGGKTRVLADELRGDGLLVAGDYRRARLALLRTTLAGDQVNARVLRLDATHPLPFRPIFDRVLVDAPCSGLGTLRRDPDLKWSRQPADLERLAGTARQILARAAEVVRPGGRLLYATCSSEPEENDAVVDAFLESRPDFALVPAVPSAAVPTLDRVVDARGLVRTLPFRDRLDAYVAAVLERRAGGLV